MAKVERQADPVSYPPFVVEYIAGLPVWKIAERYGITPKTVRKRARLLGVRPRKVKVVGKRADRLIAMYRRGVPWKKIAMVMDVNSRTITEVLRREGIKLRTFGG